MVTFIGYYYFMQTFMPLCMTLNCALITVITLAASGASVNDLYFQITGDMFQTLN